MNLPFKRRHEPAPTVSARPPVTVEPTRLVTDATILKELIPPMPARYQTRTMTECALNGFFEGLSDIKDFDMKIFALVPDLKQKLLNSSYEIPEFIWDVINVKLSFEEQAWVIYVMMRFVHVWHALKIAATNPHGYEYLCLPLELAGEENVLMVLEELKPLLVRLGLDKDKTKVNGREYSSVVDTFFENRAQLFRVYGLEDLLSLETFIVNLKGEVDYWPAEKFTDMFEGSRALLSAVEGVRRNFWTAEMHPRERVH